MMSCSQSGSASRHSSGAEWWISPLLLFQQHDASVSSVDPLGRGFKHVYTELQLWVEYLQCDLRSNRCPCLISFQTFLRHRAERLNVPQCVIVNAINRALPLLIQTLQMTWPQLVTARFRSSQRDRKQELQYIQEDMRSPARYDFFKLRERANELCWLRSTPVA